MSMENIENGLNMDAEDKEQTALDFGMAPEEIRELNEEPD